MTHTPVVFMWRAYTQKKGVPQVSDYDDLTDERDTDTDTIRQLRKVLKDRDKKIGELEGEVTTLRTNARASTVTDVLKAKGVNPKVAKLIPDSVEPTEDAVGAWLTEWADVFNISVPGEDAETAGNGAQSGAAASAVSPEARAAFETAARTEASGAVVPQLGAEQVNKTLADARGKGLDSAIAQLQAAGLVGG